MIDEEPEDDGAGASDAKRVRLTIKLAPEDEGLLRAIAIGQGRDPGDGAAALVELVRQDGRRRGLHHVVGRRYEGDKVSASQRKAISKVATAAFRARARSAGAEFAAREHEDA